MLSTSRPALPEGCISDLGFDGWRAGELDSSEVARLSAHVAVCQRCHAQKQKLESDAAAFMERFPSLDPRIRSATHQRAESRRIDARGDESLPFRGRKIRGWWGALSGGLAIAAAATLLVFLRPTGSELDSPERVKGSSRVGFFVKRDLATFRGSDGEVLHPGDQLRFFVATTEPRYVAILSRDAAGIGSVYYPQGKLSPLVQPGSEQLLESGVELDAVLGDERVFGVFCEQPFELEPVRLALERTRALPELARCTVAELRLHKEPP